MEPIPEAKRIADLRALIERQQRELAQLTEANAKAQALLAELIRRNQSAK